MPEILIKFLKIYLVFAVSTLLINIPIELLVPEKKQLLQIFMILMIFNLFGSIILLVKNYQAKTMGIVSFVLGYIFEFIIIRPDWVQNIYALKIGIGVIVPVIISAFYWFALWGIPSFVVHKFIIKTKIS